MWYNYLAEFKLLYKMNSKLDNEQLIRLDKMVKEVEEFEVRNSDIFLLGYTKSGTTWSQEMIWLLVNDLNYEGAKVFVDERFPVLEVYAFLSQNGYQSECHWNSLEFSKKMKDPRCIKSHLKWDLLPKDILDGSKTPKIIYIARNPKDVCVSAYYYFKDLAKAIDSSFEDHCNNFLMSEDEFIGTYWDHVLRFWKLRNEPNVLFIKYEEMKNDLSSVVQKVAKFLGKNITNEEESQLVNWLNFDNMKNNPAVNHEATYQKSGFMRTGKIGDHKQRMSDEMIKKFDLWIEENLKDTDYVL